MAGESEDDKTAIAVGRVIAEIAEIDGDAAAMRAAAGKEAFEEAAQRVVTHLTVTAIEANEVAQSGIAKVSEASSRAAACRAYSDVLEATTTTACNAEDIETISLLHPGRYDADIQRVAQACDTAESALAEATAALQSLLGPEGFQKFQLGVITEPSSTSEH